MIQCFAYFSIDEALLFGAPDKGFKIDVTKNFEQPDKSTLNFIFAPINNFLCLVLIL